jgi:aminoglycoside/choline kinase family phosphotransferase
MDASQVPDSVAPFVRIATHLRKMGFSAPEILARDRTSGLLLLEDFGDASFAQLLEKTDVTEQLFTLATDVLIALHRQPRGGARKPALYNPEKMLEDVELFLQWRTPGITDAGAR